MNALMNAPVNPPTNTPQAPDEIRRALRARRRALTPAELTERSEALARRVERLGWFRNARRIAGYIAVQGEIDPAPLLRRARAMGKQVFLPLLPLFSGGALWFAPFTDDTPFAPNRFGIPEPRVPRRALRRPTELDLVLTPLVAFDAAGNRMGMGGGYYDRSFAFLANRNHWRHPRLLGVAHDFQRLETIATQPWDVPLDGVASEARMYLRATASRRENIATAPNHLG